MDRLLRELSEGPTLPPCRSAGRIVPGEGSAESGLVIVGEAPGAQEEKAGRPFVGPAGKLLRSSLQAQGLPPSDVWITNVVKCRPTRAAGGREANRAPTRTEAELWTPWLMREMELLRPKLILCLGNLAADTLIRRGFKMGSEHGRWHDASGGARALATYHPSYVLRQIGPDSARVRDIFLADIAAFARAAQTLVR